VLKAASFAKHPVGAAEDGGLSCLEMGTFLALGKLIV
jgi:hypothetical protein